MNFVYDLHMSSRTHGLTVIGVGSLELLRRQSSGGLLWPRKGSLMKTQTRILDNRLYYTREIELHTIGKKSRTIRITSILICGIGCPPHPTGMYGTKLFFFGESSISTHPTFPKMPTVPSVFPLLGAPQAPDYEPNHPKG